MTSNFPTANNNIRNNNSQVAYAQYVGAVPSDSYNVSVEAEADTVPIQSTYGTTNTPIVNATLTQEQPNTALPPFSQALNSSPPTGAAPTSSSSSAAAYSRPSKPASYGNTGTTTTTTTNFPASGPTLTGNEYLRLLKEDRKRRTVSSGFLGGTVGLLLLGPVGAVIGGTISALVTKHSRKRQERYLREQLRQQGALEKPVVAQIRRHY